MQYTDLRKIMNIQNRHTNLNITQQILLTPEVSGVRRAAIPHIQTSDNGSTPSHLIHVKHIASHLIPRIHTALWRLCYFNPTCYNRIVKRILNLRNFYTTIFLVIFLICCHHNAAAQNVAFPDANLAAAVRSALSLGATDPITETALAGLTTLTVEARRVRTPPYSVVNEVKDLTGLQHATGLTTLTITNNMITPEDQLNADKLGPILKLPLEKLNLGYNNISDISGLSGLTQLTYLNLEKNKIGDISPLAGLKALEYLDLWSNPITDISILTKENFPNLLYLNLRDTWVRDFSAIDGEYWIGKFNADTSDNRLFICNSILENWDYDGSGDGAPLGKIDPNTFNWIAPSQWTANDRARIKEQLNKPTCAPVFSLEPTGENTSVRLVVNADADLSPNYVTLTYVYRYRKSGDSWPQTRTDTATSQFTGGFVNPPPGEDTTPHYQGVIAQQNGEYAANITGLDPSAVYHFQVFGSVLQAGNYRNLYPPGSEKKCWSTSAQSEIACPVVLPQRGQPPQVESEYIRGPNRTPDNLAFRGQIGFSELMFDTGGEPDALPQWIELCNVSQTDTVNLWDWTLEIEARDAEGEHRHASVRLNNLQILPNETALIVTSEVPNSVNLLKWSVYNFFEHHPNAFRDNQRQHKRLRQNSVLGQTGFFLRLSHPTDGVSDVVGNLDGDRWTQDAPAWELPSGLTANGARISLMRHYQHGKSVFPDGTTSANWQRAADVELEVMTYWGKETDIGNPGRKAGWRFPGGDISFSELMFASKGGLHSLPQWIELYNASETGIVDLADWQLEIEARDANGEHRYAVITLDRFIIQPRQSGLLVTWGGRHAGILKDSIYYLTSRMPNAFDRNQALGQSGFFLRLSDPEGITRDIAGNLDGDKLTADTPKWKLPSGITEDHARQSMMRRYQRLTRQPFDGRKSVNWIPASKIALRVRTYWGRKTDIGTPGYSGGNPLPVSLSHFRPERTDTGGVAIKWTTASEKDTAGFNILRSQQASGRFVRLNPKLIAGGGTTSERQDYIWRDTTAKLDVVYYYRLEEVSFSGDRQQLATAQLRGHITAWGKMMTTWSGLKY